MIDLVHRHVIPAAYAVLPDAMASKEATAMLLAIGLQESRFAHRRQVGGPARGFWQFERGGILGVLTHRSSGIHVQAALAHLRYPPDPEGSCYALVEHNDVLAAVFARLLLWTLPAQLPGPVAASAAWAQYLSGWRPGKPHRDSWDAFYAEAWQRVEAA